MEREKEEVLFLILIMIKSLESEVYVFKQVAQQLQLARQQAGRSESEREEGKKELLGEISFFVFSQRNVSL